MPQQGKGFKQGYYQNMNTISHSRPVLLSGNVQSEHVAEGKSSNNDIIRTLTL